MIVVLLALLGLAIGSFINALVWRMHSQIDKKKQKELSIWSGRSICPHCRHRLNVLDLVPVLSWVFLKGKCRYCHKLISLQYPLIELLTTFLYIFSYTYWPLPFHSFGLFEFICWLVFLAGFVALILYDFKWLLLPNKIIYPLILLACVQVGILSTVYHGSLDTFLAGLGGVVVLGGLFYILFQVSNGRWIGGGDIKLGILLGLLVGGYLPGLLTLSFSSILGTAYALPLIVQGKAKKSSRIPYGPFLIIAAFIVRLFGQGIIHWYRVRLYK